jgi:uncharacterized protein (TIGR03435 family)
MLLMRCFLAVLALVPSLLPPAIAQTRFEVASIHPSRPGAGPRDGRFMFHGDSFDAEAATVGDILDMLNGWQLHRVVGGPPWMTADRYDIHAKANVAIPKEEQHDALMALLADRFQLSVHRETRDIPAMVLLAPKKPAGVKPATAGESYSVPYFARDVLTFTAVPMSGLTNYLSNVWQSPVIDQTGLQGTFDFTLNPSAAAMTPGESWGDRIHEALLAVGFKIEYRKMPTEVIVVDHCERPSEN